MSRYIFLFHVDRCIDQLPPDNQCVWTCPDWAAKTTINSRMSYCDYQWSTLSHCVLTTQGTVKDSCKVSCSACKGIGHHLY